MMNTQDGTHYLCELVKTLNGNRNAGSYLGDFTVSAVVGGNTKVSDDIIKCQLTIKHDSVDISMYWEECGYKGFRDMGLYGRTNSKYFEVDELTDRQFKITDKSSGNTTEFNW